MQRIELAKSNGIKEYLIVNEIGKELGVLAVDVTDLGFPKRTEIAQKNIDALLKEAKTAMENTDTEASYELLYKLDAKVKQEIDTMFQTNVSEVVFGGTHCLSIGNGKTFIERFFDSVIPVILKDSNAAMKESEKKLAKYKPMDHLEKKK